MDTLHPLRHPPAAAGAAPDRWSLVGLGVAAWKRLPIDAFPDVTNVQVMILTEAPGLAPLDVERRSPSPSRSAMDGLPGVRQVRSLSKAGLSQVVVVFEDDVDTYFARQLVFERLAEAREQLPAGVEPEMGPISTGLGEIYQYTLESDTHGLMELRTMQDWLVAPRLRTIPGVNEVNSFGGFVKQYHVRGGPRRAAQVRHHAARRGRRPWPRTTPTPAAASSSRAGSRPTCAAWG